MAGYAHPEYLVETGWLADHLGDPGLRLFDCSVDIAYTPGQGSTIRNGRDAYLAGHIPGAAFIDMLDEFADTAAPTRFMLPARDQFVRQAGAYGIGDGLRVVLYNRGPTWWSTRMWWNLKAHGFDNAAVLNGGLDAWIAEGRAVETGERRYPAQGFTSRWRPGLIVGKDAVLDAIADPAAVLINGLSRELHSGEQVNYGRPGHIKRSVNVPARELLDDSLRFRPADELRAAFAPVKAMEAKRVVTYCGGGISATTDLFALALLGHPGVQLYDASLVEWGRDDSLPMETGA